MSLKIDRRLSVLLIAIVGSVMALSCALTGLPVELGGDPEGVTPESVAPIGS